MSEFYVGDFLLYGAQRHMNTYGFNIVLDFGGDFWNRTTIIIDKKTKIRYRKIILTSQTFNCMTHDHRPLIDDILKDFKEYQIKWEIMQYDYINYPELLVLVIYFFTGPEKKGKVVDTNGEFVSWKRDYCRPIKLPIKILSSTSLTKIQRRFTLSMETNNWLKELPNTDREDSMHKVLDYYSTLCDDFWSGQNY